MDFQNLKKSDFVAAAMNPTKSRKMEWLYKRKMGATLGQLQEQSDANAASDIKDEEAMQKFLDTKSMEKFLDLYEQKIQPMRFVNKLLLKYLRNEPVLSSGMRSKYWRITTKADKNSVLNRGYYQSLVDSLEDPFNNFAQVIDLDVRRTPAAIKNKSIYQQLTNILLAYAKRNSRVGYCQGLNGIVVYFLQRKIPEEVASFHSGMFLDSGIYHRRSNASRLLYQHAVAPSRHSDSDKHANSQGSTIVGTFQKGRC